MLDHDLSCQPNVHMSIILGKRRIRITRSIKTYITYRGVLYILRCHDETIDRLTAWSLRRMEKRKRRDIDLEAANVSRILARQRGCSRFRKGHICRLKMQAQSGTDDEAKRDFEGR